MQNMNHRLAVSIHIRVHFRVQIFIKKSEWQQKIIYSSKYNLQQSIRVNDTILQ